MEKVKDEKQKKLSETAKDLIKQETKSTLKDEIAYLRDDLSEIVLNHIIKTKKLSKKEYEKDQIILADTILKKYITIKKEIKNIEKSLFNEAILEEEKEKLLEKYMQIQFKEVDSDMYEMVRTYKKLLQIYNFIKNSINTYKEDIKRKIAEDGILLEDKYKKNDNISEKNKKYDRIRNRIETNERKLYILENLYEKNISGSILIKERYESEKGERDFFRDKKTVLFEISEYFSLIDSILNLI